MRVLRTVQGTLAVTDAQLYVSVAGVINPAGLPATLGGTAVDVADAGVPVATVTLPASGRYRSPAGVTPRVTITLSPRNGKYRVRLARSDLRTTIGLPNTTVRVPQAAGWKRPAPLVQ
ncbi:MAG: hypothetical protein E6J75_04930 [Deltaproteobacteria bacterium]|nr:MAG: hypothetical protein E6J75_04930 [Deltaproteobacteria bacterium]